MKTLHLYPADHQNVRHERNAIGLRSGIIVERVNLHSNRVKLIGSARSLPSIPIMRCQSHRTDDSFAVKTPKAKNAPSGRCLKRDAHYQLIGL